MNARLRTALAFCLVLGVMISALPRLGLAEHGLVLTVPGSIRPYQNESITLEVPANGSLTLHAQALGRQYLIVKDVPVEKGSLNYPFSGLSINGEALPRGDAQLQAQLVTGDETFKATAAFRVLQPAAGISYVLLSRDSLSIHDEESLYADYQLSKPGNLIVSLYREGEDEQPLFRRTYNRNDMLPHTYRWNKKIGNQPAPTGSYYFLFEAQGSQQGAIKRPFTLTDEPYTPATIAVTPQGHFLPETLDDQSVWAAMMAPITVIDIGAMQHQKVYAEPSTKSKVVGMMHGQTAAVEILELGPAGFLKIRAARHGDGKWMTGYIPDKRLKTITPHERYGLLIDKNAQTISVYERGNKLGTLSVSTGVYVPPGTSSFDTVPGAFITQDRIAEYVSKGARYEYPIRIDGGNLLHSAGYQLRNGMRDYSLQKELLGQIATHGCVRIAHDLNEQEMNAWWLYANLPRNTKVLVLPSDDNLQPEHVAQEPVSIEDNLKEDLAQEEELKEDSSQEEELKEDPPQAAASAEELTEVPDPEPAAEPIIETVVAFIPAFQVMGEEDLANQQGSLHPDAAQTSTLRTSITLTFGGDCVLGSEEHSRRKPESFHGIVEEKGMAWPFSGLAEIFNQDDLSMVNLENVLQNDKKGFTRRTHNFRGPIEFANILKFGGIDLVNIANNHYVDYGQDGKNSTRRALQDAGIPYAGYSHLHIYEKNGVKIGFGGIRETIFRQNHRRIADEIEELKRQGCDYIVYTCHFGNEYEKQHNELQTLMAHTAIDAGANLVIGHHTHVVQGIEVYNGGLIFYSLGNLVFGGNLELTTFDGLMAQVRLQFEGNGLSETAVRLIPVITSGVRPQNDFRPVVAQGEDKARIMNTLNQDSEQVYPEEFVLR
ncbi:MAG: L,D-transpeptidase family protein [Clostridiales bacterium]|nr:L,D-transpeptidase family protein [Clostridiales bacterium]